MVEDPGIDDFISCWNVSKDQAGGKTPKNTLRVFAEGLFRAELSKL